MTAWDRLARALSPVEDRPCVAPRLESAAYQTRARAPYVVVHNPATHTYARLDPREFELLSLMDGTRTVKELVLAYYQRFGVFALARVAGLVALLKEQQLLTVAAVDVYAVLARSLRGRRPRSLPTQLTTEAADCLLARAYSGWGHVFFHRVWLYVGLGLGLLGPALVVVELVRRRYLLYDVGGWGALTIVVLAVLTLLALAIHELGHGLAVKHAGRRVHRAGLRLYFGLPAAFVDTSDIWMAPPAQRLLTAFAGPWTGLVLGGLCAIGASLLPTSAPGALLFTAAFVFVVDNLFNFNPLLELDGYYMLIDYLDRPLLRARALAFVRGPVWARLWRRQPLSGEEWLLAGFGAASVIYAVVAIFLAIRAWQALLLPLIVANLTSPDLPRQLFGLLLALVVAVPIVLGGLALLRAVLGAARERLEWLSGRAAQHRHRQALAALRAVPPFADLPGGRLLEVARAMRAEAVAPGTEVVRQGEAGDRFYLIAQGAFEVRVDDRPEARLGRGDFFGERALLERVPRAATVVATTPSRVFVLDRADFDALLASDLAVRSRIQSALAYRDEVAAMPLFRELSPAELDILLARLLPLEVSPGQVIIAQGEPGDRFYVVRSGCVRVERDGERLAELGPGDSFGEIALLWAVPRTATVTAVEPTRLLALGAPEFRDVLATYLGRAGELERLSHLRLSAHRRLDEVM